MAFFPDLAAGRRWGGEGAHVNFPTPLEGREQTTSRLSVIIPGTQNQSVAPSKNLNSWLLFNWFFSVLLGLPHVVDNFILVTKLNRFSLLCSRIPTTSPTKKKKKVSVKKGINDAHLFSRHNCSSLDYLHDLIFCRIVKFSQHPTPKMWYWINSVSLG